MAIKACFGVSVGVFLAIGGAEAQATQLLLNPSFETPVVTTNNCGAGPAASCFGFNLGASIGGWTVVGPGATGSAFPVLILTSAYSGEGTDHFIAEDGNQSLDLSGSGNQGPNGVIQSVATTPGAAYELSFFIGNEDNSLPFFGANSAATLLVNGVNEGVYTNANNTPNNLNWEQFKFDFLATSGSTSIEFLNATPAADYEAGLDNVTLVQLPEPGSLGLMAVGLVAMWTLRRRNQGPRVVQS